jgi:hypothetical protein
LDHEGLDVGREVHGEVVAGDFVDFQAGQGQGLPGGVGTDAFGGSHVDGAEAGGLGAELEKKHGKGKALSILAAKLGRAVYYMLLRRRPFELQRFVIA